MKARALNEKKFLVVGELLLATERLIKKAVNYFNDCMCLVNTVLVILIALT